MSVISVIDFAAQGYRMPAEWEPQRAVVLAWPHNHDTWPGKFGPVPSVYVHLIRHIVDHQELWLLVPNDLLMTARQELILGGVDLTRVQFLPFATNDTWVRDYGPITIVRDHQGRRECLFTDWIFNGWGGKYYGGGYPADDEVPMHLGQVFGVPCHSLPFILEGGSIDVNGCGTLITSKSCLLNANRNANLTQNQIEEVLRSVLGIRKVIWVDEGIAGDDTDGHIDDTVRFVDANTLICMVEPNVNDDNHLPLQRVFDALQTVTDQDGRPLRVVPIPMPPRVEFANERLPASYANFLITNHKVLVPTYRSVVHDQCALSILQSLFPTRCVVGVDATDLVLGLGAFHCISQNIPSL